jgi:hypothetical protein
MYVKCYEFSLIKRSPVLFKANFLHDMFILFYGATGLLSLKSVNISKSATFSNLFQNPKLAPVQLQNRLFREEEGKQPKCPHLHFGLEVGDKRRHGCYVCTTRGKWMKVNLFALDEPLIRKIKTLLSAYTCNGCG